MTTAHRLSRRTDPSSSAKAAQRHVASGANQTQGQRVLAALREHPGSTSAELAQHMGVDRYLVARRLPDLESAGLVVRGPERECRAHGGAAVTWTPWRAEKQKPSDKRAQLEMFAAGAKR